MSGPFISEWARIANWARWARDNRRSIGHCVSIEHRYRSPQCWWPEEPRLEVDLFDAVDVEKVVRRLSNPYQKPFVLYWAWGHGNGVDLKQEALYAILRILSKRYGIGINRDRLWDRILEAQLMVRNGLGGLDKSPKICSTEQNLIPSRDELAA